MPRDTEQQPSEIEVIDVSLKFINAKIESLQDQNITLAQSVLSLSKRIEKLEKAVGIQK